jgi:hypothetical protein
MIVEVRSKLLVLHPFTDEVDRIEGVRGVEDAKEWDDVCVTE